MHVHERNEYKETKTHARQNKHFFLSVLTTQDYVQHKVTPLDVLLSEGMQRCMHAVKLSLEATPKYEHVGTGKQLTNESSPPAIISYRRKPLTTDKMILHNSKGKKL